MDLIEVGVPLSDGVGGASLELWGSFNEEFDGESNNTNRVVVGDVGGQAADEAGRSSVLVQRSEKLSGG